MKKISFLLLMVIFAFNNLQANAPAKKKDFLGTWEFKSQYAPAEYQTGVFIIEEKEGELAGEVRFSDQYKLKMDSMNVTDGVLNFVIYIDYTPIKLKATIEDKVLKGTAASPDGDIPFEAKKAEKKLKRPQ